MYYKGDNSGLWEKIALNNHRLLHWHPHFINKESALTKNCTL
jgi:hypothetical protein